MPLSVVVPFLVSSGLVDLASSFLVSSSLVGAGSSFVAGLTLANCHF